MAAGSRFLTFAAALVASAALAAPAMAANTYYASPTGGGVDCTQAAPCSPSEAVNRAASGDGVILLPGTYTLSSSLQIARSISFGGESETNTTIQTSGSAGIEVGESADATVHDIRLDTAESLELKSGTAERIFVDYTGTSVGRSACSVDPGTSLLDSVCWAHGGSPSAGAIFSEAAVGTGNTVTLRNDTAIAAGPESVGIFAELESSTADLTVSATNVIVHGGTDDIGAVGGGGSSKMTVALAHSDYATVAAPLPGVTITAPGTNGNVTAAPAFVEAGSGNFAEAPGSPTIDAGLTEAADGPVALAGESRALPAVCGGTPVTDIGAYEFVPTGCPPATTTSPTAAVQTTLAPSNRIVLRKVKRNAKKGTATLAVSVPGAGTLVLTGKGIGKVSRRATGAARLKLPVRPVGKARRRLARTGSARFRLTLSFVPVGGSVGTATRSVKLIEEAADVVGGPSQARE
ncbi:MAG TPA: hypothetical protein VHA76_05170 [Solirubrobacterales bacterium]|nr:hypothetical protein [Solirubrobacterales bacterium]